MDDRFRTWDADRDRVAALLRDHFAAGRLTPEELDARLTATLNAKTFGDLRRVLADLPVPAPVLQHVSLSRVPPEAGRLERSYRRLLFLYPARYRRVHEEEMLAVLMTSAPAGKRRPGIREAADLIWGALRVRFQPSRIGGQPAWRDALAALSVILPVIILVISVVQETQIWLPPPMPGIPSYRFPLSALQQPALAVAGVALVLLRLRRVAMLAAAVMVLWIAFLSGGSTYIWATEEAYLFVPLILEIVALAASPGPRRGLQILTWKHGALVIIAAVAVSNINYVVILSYPVNLIVVAVIGAAMLLASSLGRWLLVLLTIAAWPFSLPPLPVTPWEFYLPYGLGVIGLAYLVPAALLAVFVMAARRESRRSSPFPGSAFRP
jgi:Domain of unknown function (DUF1707)